MWWWWRRYIVVSLGKTSQILKGIHMLVMEMSRYWPLQRPEADKSWSYDDDLHCFGDHRCQVELSKWTLCWRRSWSSSKSDVVKCHLESPPEVRWPGRGGILAKLTFETIKEELHKHKVAQKDGLIMQPCFLSRIVTEYEDWRTSKQLAVFCNETSGITTPNRNVCPHQSQEQAPKGPALLCTSSPLWRALHGSTDAKRSRDQVKLLCKTWQSRLITLLEPHCKSQHSRLTRLLDCKTAGLLHCYHTRLLFFKQSWTLWLRLALRRTLKATYCRWIGPS